MDLAFVKAPEMTIGAYIREVSKKVGDEIEFRHLLRFQVGEPVAS